MRGSTRPITSRGSSTSRPGVRLHYLDFGGTGQPLVFLAGLGNTAHAYDDFAPAFTDRFHVVALTRRGFGESSHPDVGLRYAEAGRRHSRRARPTASGSRRPDRTFDRGRRDDAVRRRSIRIASRSSCTSTRRTIASRRTQCSTRCSPRRRTFRAGRSRRAADTATAAGYVDVRAPHSRREHSRGGHSRQLPVRRMERGDHAVPTSRSASEHPNYRAVRAPALAIYAVADTVTQLEPWQRADAAHAAGLQADDSRHRAGGEAVARAISTREWRTAACWRFTAATTGSSSAIAMRCSPRFVAFSRYPDEPPYSASQSRKRLRCSSVGTRQDGGPRTMR